ncbi:hypothetical protein K3556_15010 [Aliiroseovarius sp. M344]|uniref:hypothetical protein n=1 Tax=Aliiroseovarius sp. M344 TaxID=2867010 RepID=UPI0021ADC39C|nr:hypothetical protein [Aliiroseovarius sp. M344]UWQ14197.1 hypothetical protein K3556_15010 [Aliiroseovarius sp. M344]
MSLEKLALSIDSVASFGAQDALDQKTGWHPMQSTADVIVERIIDYAASGSILWNERSGIISPDIETLFAFGPLGHLNYMRKPDPSISFGKYSFSKKTKALFGFAQVVGLPKSEGDRIKNDYRQRAIGLWNIGRDNISDLQWDLISSAETVAAKETSPYIAGKYQPFLFIDRLWRVNLSLWRELCSFKNLRKNAFWKEYYADAACALLSIEGASICFPSGDHVSGLEAYWRSASEILTNQDAPKAGRPRKQEMAASAYRKLYPNGHSNSWKLACRQILNEVGLEVSEKTLKRGLKLE